jgi:thiol:disulfide interchange protein
MYKDSFALISDHKISPINFDKIKWIVKEDPFLGIKKVIYNKVEIEYDVKSSLSRLDNQKVSMNVEYQGCKENTYCYPIKSTVIFL